MGLVPPGVLAALSAWRGEPSPLSRVLVTVNVAACVVAAASANAPATINFLARFVLVSIVISALWQGSSPCSRQFLCLFYVPGHSETQAENRALSGKGRIWYTATVVASAVRSRWARCTKLAGDSQRYNAHPFSDGGSVQMRPRAK